MPSTASRIAADRARGTAGAVSRAYLSRTSSAVSGFSRVPRACSTRRVSVRPSESDSSTIDVYRAG
jgi:hypothetical protein